MKVSLDTVQHTFQDRNGLTALDEISLEMESGHFTAVIGPSGCGKSTLLRIIAGLVQPSSGQVLLDDKPVDEMVRQRRIAWMAQKPALLPWLTVAQNASLAQKFQSVNGKNSDLVNTALEKTGLYKYRDMFPVSLSGGMQQRLALARILIQEADLWLMDEPFASLDEISREKLAAELLQLWEPLQPTVIWITHNLHEAVKMADRILVMSPGPGRITGDLSINLPRPREELNSSFQDLLQTLRNTLGMSQEPDHE